MNKYLAFSKTPNNNDDELLTWKLKFDYNKLMFVVTFSDGTKKHFAHRDNAIRYINEKFFSMYI